MTRDEILKTIQEVIDTYIPIGTIQCFAMNSLPNVGVWKECDGSVLNKNEYNKLYSIIGDTFSYDLEDASAFKIPNLQGQFIRGYDPECIVDSAPREFGSIQNHALQGHHHKINQTNETDPAGKHTHTVRARQVSINNGAFSSERVLKYLLSDGSDSAPSDESGVHTHGLPKISIGKIENGSYGTVNVKTETRPTNIALMFCIRVK